MYVWNQKTILSTQALCNYLLNLILLTEDLEQVYHYASVLVAYLGRLSNKKKKIWNNWNFFCILLNITKAGYHGYPLHLAQTNCNCAKSSFFPLFLCSFSDSESDELPDELLPSVDDPLPVVVVVEFEPDSEPK